MTEQVPLQREAARESVFSKLGIHSTLGQKVSRNGGNRQEIEKGEKK